jgi:hydrogenase maturation factor HypF (carbamoyltransferase family)
MAGFVMCARCAAEYHDPADRRFHAQPICCPACGPTLSLLDRAETELSGQPLAAAADLLRLGGVLAVKGLGGYHLAVDATSQAAAATLRERKVREDKPFAVMVPNVAAARQLGEVEAAAALLTSGRRPIVLLARRPGDHHPAVTRLRTGTAQRAPRVPAARPGLRGRAEEHVLPGQGESCVRVAPHRGPGERRDAALVR